MNILAIIPSRGGSKGIPRKNLRSLMQKPLIYYAINTAKSSKHKLDVYVSSEDEEILSISEQFGASTHLRSNQLAEDHTTLDPVIFDAYETISAKENKQYDIIITLQATSPLLTTQTLDNAIDQFIGNTAQDTLISVINDTHLSWRNENEQFKPNYAERLNRQYLPQEYRETGAFLMCRAHIISKNSRIGSNTQLYEIPARESIDIDTYADWNVCEYYLRRKNILIVLRGNNTIGMGHVYNALIIANSILNHEISFLVSKDSKLAYQKIASNNYQTKIQQGEQLLDDIYEIAPDVVINDLLDTSAEYMDALKQKSIVSINFEDLGPGAAKADLVFNALYPEKEELKNHFFGANYFLARDEFLITPINELNEKVTNVLVTYGGTDPNNLTLKTIQSIYEFCNIKGINISVIAGKGYENYDDLASFKNIEIHKDVTNISWHMNKADVIFSSAGRTIYEIALMGTPAIIMGQNNREMTHFFASEKHGFINLGLGAKTSENNILKAFETLALDFKSRSEMREKMLSLNIKNGKNEVLRLINQTIETNAIK